MSYADITERMSINSKALDESIRQAERAKHLLNEIVMQLVLGESKRVIGAKIKDVMWSIDESLKNIRYNSVPISGGKE